tara:strand:- start:43330 stop:45171 length:1842 start_codon:yes stop_codon:yes gene_type:complete
MPVEAAHHNVPNSTNRSVCAILAVQLVVLVTMLALAARADESWHHALAMHGEAAYPDGPTEPFRFVNPEAPVGGTLRLSELGTFDTMNPYIVFGSPARGLGLVYQSLLYRSPDEPFTLYPQLAQAIEIADDRSWIVFHLDPRARFQDGSAVTADDVLFTFIALLKDGKPHTQTYYSGVTATTRVDDLTVRFDLEPDNWELPMLLGLMPVLSQTYYQDVDFSRTSLEAPLGTGPYKIVEIDPGRRVVYQRDPDYWGWDLPQSIGRFNFKTVEYTWYRDSNVALQAFLAGDVDIRFETDALRWATGYDSPAVQEGEIILEELPHGRPSGLQAVVWNQRRPPIDDIRVREALGLAFDFAWTNANLLHNQYERTTSLFGNSDLAATGPLTPGEQALLTPWLSDLPSELIEGPFLWPETDGSGRLRENLRQASALLEEAGFVLQDGVLRSTETGVPLTFELLLADPSFERIMLPWLRNIERLGIQATLRSIDAAQHHSRIASFDFDAIIWHWGVSLSPGNEQWIYWGSDAADSEGSRNYAGIQDPVLDDLIATLSDARDAMQLTSAARALDRVLSWGRHVVPLYHRTNDPVARWRPIKHPDQLPLYGADITTWWYQSP